MMGVRVRLVLGLAVLGALLLVAAVTQQASAASARCQPVTIESMFPSAPPDAPSVAADAPSVNVPEPAPAPAARCSYVYSMTHPVAIDAQVLSPFGTNRDGGARKHLGSDIMAPKLTPVLAVADGVVSWLRDEIGGDCCALGIRHDDGWRSYYIHLNNDTFGTDDGQGFGMAPGIELGTRVTAGQLVGFIGDSGNAEATLPHLHFELRTPANIPIDAGPSLRNAARFVSAGAGDEDGAETASALFGTTSASFRGAFVDDDVSTHAEAIDSLASIGVVSGCDDGLLFCPDAAATGRTITGWLQRSLDVAVHPEEVIAYADGGIAAERALLNQLSAAMTIEEIRGCGDRRFCSDEPLTRGEFAALLVGVLEIGGNAADAYVDDQGHRFEADIELLVREGVFDTCARPSSPLFWPDRDITRGEVATFVARIIGLAGTTECTVVR